MIALPSYCYQQQPFRNKLSTGQARLLMLLKLRAMFLLNRRGEYLPSSLGSLFKIKQTKLTFNSKFPCSYQRASKNLSLYTYACHTNPTANNYGKRVGMNRTPQTNGFEQTFKIRKAPLTPLYEKPSFSHLKD